MNELKLFKYLQRSGLANRRLIRRLIADGKIKVNGQTISNPAFPVQPEKDRIFLRRKELKLRLEKTCTFAFHKPKGVVSTLADPQGRPTVKDFIRQIRERVYPVGRLDFHSEGLLLLTNDGDLAHFILAARNQVPKVYMVKIKGVLSEAEKGKLEHGIVLDGQRLAPFRIEFVRSTPQQNAWYRVTISEGKKHILRRTFQYSGHPVEKLRRTAIGTIQLKSLPAGHWRELTETEIAHFKKICGFSSPSAAGKLPSRSGKFGSGSAIERV